MDKTSNIKYVTYWETANGECIPPYVLLSLVSMKRAIGKSLLILTPKTISNYLNPEQLAVDRYFAPLPFNLETNKEKIVAKSDYIRIAYIYKHGGVWLDADSLLLKNPSTYLFPKGLEKKLHWYSEALFASRANNKLLKNALEKMEDTTYHNWGNPGSIKNIVDAYKEEILSIPQNLVDPGYHPAYNFSTCEVMYKKDITVTDFLTRDIAIIKLYNTYFSRTFPQKQNIHDFLSSETLLSKLFLHIEPEINYWLNMSEELLKEL